MSIQDLVYLGVQSLIAVLAVGCLLYLIAIGREIPADLSGLVGAIIGMYFRTVQSAVSSEPRREVRINAA